MDKKISLTERICKEMVSSNNAGYAAILIAAFKGVFRPIITLRDKKKPEKERKYAAIREALTEALAVPIYLITSMYIPDKLKKPLATDPKNLKTVENVRGNVAFISVCIATFIIPLLCNWIMPPVMKAIKKYEDGKKKKNGSLDVVSPSQIPEIPVQTPQIQKQETSNPINISYPGNSGMRVGM
jgi:hypothetical protein